MNIIVKLMEERKIVEYDIILDKDVKEVINGAVKRGATTFKNRLWPNGTVLYELQNNFGE